MLVSNYRTFNNILNPFIEMTLETCHGYKRVFFFTMKKFGIYKITCTINDKVYIGSTEVCFKQRFKKHKQRLRNDYHENDYLQKSWNKYGEENFIFEILEEILDKSKVKEIEQIYLNDYILKGKDFCFNLSKSATGGNTITNDDIKEKHKQGVINSYTDELRDLRRQQMLKRLPEMLEKSKKSQQSREYKDRHLKIMQELCKTEEWLKKVRENNAKGRKPVGTDRGEIFESVTEASEILKINRANIRANINGKTSHCANRQWFYINK